MNRNLSLFPTLFFLLTLGLLSAQVSAQTPVSQTASPLEQAGQMLSVGNTRGAIETLAAAIRLNPNDAALRFMLGKVYFASNDYPRAIQYLSFFTDKVRTNNQANNQAPEQRQAVQMLAMAHYLSGRFKDAIPHFTQALAPAPDNNELRFALGVSYIQTNDRDGARRTYAEMFNLDARSAPAYLLNAQMMVRQQFEEQAELELREAARLDAKLPQVHFMLGEIAIYKARIDEGILLLEQEIKINPAFAMAYYRLGEAMTRQQKWTESIAPLQKSIWLNPYFSGPYIVLGKVYFKQADTATAEAMLRRAIQMDPNNASAHHLLAQVLQQTNRAEEARKEFEIAERLRGVTATK